MRKFLFHQTKREELIKFLLLLSVVLAYFGYLSWEYDLATGGVVSALTWSFFVLCTPIADAGFLLDFPVRLITGIRMFVTEILVWGLAVVINIICLLTAPDAYSTTFLTSLFHKILTTPWPYWSIIALCSAGTFLSIRFGDEMMDVVSHKERDLHHKHGFTYRLVALGALIALIVVAYYFLLDSLGVQLPQ
ncbi:MAG: hypothetical protein ABJN40_11070 [Sneathiella sp.]